MKNIEKPHDSLGLFYIESWLRYSIFFIFADIIKLGKDFFTMSLRIHHINVILIKKIICLKPRWLTGGSLFCIGPPIQPLVARAVSRIFLLGRPRANRRSPSRFEKLDALKDAYPPSQKLKVIPTKCTFWVNFVGKTLRGDNKGI
jgi:hypothetical protein